MKFSEAELKYYPVADVLTEQDRADYAVGRPCREARTAMFLWFCNHTGNYDVSDAYLNMRLGSRMLRRLVSRQTGRIKFKGFRVGGDYRARKEIPVLCESCGFEGNALSPTKLEAVCPVDWCKSIHLKFL